MSGMPDIRHFPAVPIVGQPVQALGWTLVVNVLCKCEHPQIVPLVVKQTQVARVSDLGICPNCGRHMHVAGLTQDPQGQFAFQIQCTEAAPSVPSTPAS